jgi:hypothetical protein
MKVDAPGLVAAAQRLLAALEPIAADHGVPHAPLAADPASVGAAQRLTTASTALAAGLTDHVSALVVSLEHLTGIAVVFTETDQQNAAAIATLNPGSAGPAPVIGSAPPPPPIPPDVRPPLPPPAGMMPEALSAATHSGSASAGEPFTAAWTAASGAARDASQHLRSAVAHLPETLDGPASTPAASTHLMAFADGLDHYADRGQALVTQADGYANNLAQARHDIPTPAQHTEAQHRVLSLAQANATSGGRYAVPLANAVSAKNRLNERTIAGYTGYHDNTDTATASDDPGSDGDPLNGATGDPATAGDPTAVGQQADSMSPESSGEIASMLPQMLPTVLGAAGGLVGGIIGAVTKVPETLMQAGTQAIGAATQGLSGLAQPKLDSSDPGANGNGPNPGTDSLGEMGSGAGGDGPTTPAGGDGAPSLAVAPTTGAPPTPAITPVGATGTPAPPSASMSGMPMAPMGGMGPMAGSPGTASGDKEGPGGNPRKVTSRDIPHTEDVTGRTDTNRLAAAARRDPRPPHDDDAPPPDSTAPVVRRLTTRPPKEPT